MPSERLSVSEVARRLGIARLTARKKLLDGSIPGGREVLGTLRVEKVVFEKWAKKQGF